MVSQRKGLKSAKNLFAAWAIYCLWYVKIEPSQNQDLSTSLERTYKELWNALFLVLNSITLNSNFALEF